MARACAVYRFDSKIVEQVRPLYKLDNFHGPLAVVRDLLVIVVSAAIASHIKGIAIAIAIVIIGSRQRALATILHECAHGTFAKSRAITLICGTALSGYLIGQTFGSYKKSHLHFHHGMFGDPEKDVDYNYMLGKGLYSTQGFRAAVRFVLCPLLLLNVPGFLCYLVKNRFLSFHDNVTELVLFTVYWAIILAALQVTNTVGYLLLYWLVPFITSFSVIGWFIEMAEHGLLMRNKIDLYMSRNRNSHWFEMLLTGVHGESFHLAHHQWPRVPFWNMRKLHSILLQDRNYKEWDGVSGGIFCSSNRAPTAVQVLINSRLAGIDAEKGKEP